MRIMDACILYLAGGSACNADALAPQLWKAGMAMDGRPACIAVSLKMLNGKPIGPVGGHA
jgi:hypothetical protein